MALPASLLAAVASPNKMNGEREQQVNVPSTHSPLGVKIWEMEMKKQNPTLEDEINNHIEAHEFPIWCGIGFIFWFYQKYKSQLRHLLQKIILWDYVELGCFLLHSSPPPTLFECIFWQTQKKIIRKKYLNPWIFTLNASWRW